MIISSEGGANQFSHRFCLNLIRGPADK